MNQIVHKNRLCQQSETYSISCFLFYVPRETFFYYSTIYRNNDLLFHVKHYSEIKNRRILTRIDLKTYFTGTNTSLPPI